MAVTALPLNILERRYETRSSDHLFVYYTVTLCVSLVSLYILSENGDQEPVASNLIELMSYFTAAIAAAFFIEAYPRGNTRVQRLAREKENQNALQQANLFSRLSHHYLQSIVSLGATRPLTGDDLVNTTPAVLLTNPNYERVALYWEKDKAQSAANHRQPSFLWTVLRAYRGEIIIMLAARVVGYSLLYAPPMLFGQLLRFINDYSVAARDGTEPPALKTGFVITSAMLFFNITSIFTVCFAFLLSTDLSIQARGAAVALIYRKSLKLSPQAKQSSTLGEITNHMAVDADKLVEAAFFLPLLITVPFELVVSTYLLYQLLGWSLVAGLVVFAILVPVQARMVSFMNGYQEGQLKWMDSRVRLMTEILSNIKIVKLYHWYIENEDSRLTDKRINLPQLEVPFRKKIDALRANELHSLKGMATIRSILTIVFSSVTLLMALGTFWVFAYFGGPNMTPGKMTSEVVFVSITLFGIMNRPLGLVTDMLSRTIAVNVAMQRIQKFLLMEEIDTTVVRRYGRQPRITTSGKDPVLHQPLSVDIENGTFAWEKEVPDMNTTTSKDAVLDGERQPLLAAAKAQPTRPALSNITLRIPDGSLTAIVGRIGQGKSSLLSAIIGEMYKRNGSVTVYGDLAYVPQQAWIVNATVRDNILFGKPFDQIKYDNIINASGLQPDLEMLVAGDKTEIGERGINLSGGQKQRVSLARAAYQDADIYLLDDPLSAVDSHVDQHLWQNLIGPTGLLKDKTRILVTHGIHHLEHVNQIVVLKDGSITEVGDYQHLMDSRGAFYQLIKDFSATHKRKNNKHTSSSTRQHLRDLLHGKKDTTKDGIEHMASSVSNVDMDNSLSDSEGDSSERNTIVEEAAIKKTDDATVNKDDSGELIEDEKMEEGKVGWQIVLSYAKAA
ncbi:hypothetical protein BGZ98_008618 [Dissophora globulifera]|nr:hypothetical protein BGZ98_008618 [Dissophora globulifera]